jgi:hypothetical protein
MASMLGRYLKFHVEALSAALGDAQFRELMRTEILNERQIHRLETGAWRSIDHHSLFALMCAAVAKKIFPLIEVVDSAFWETFFLPGKSGLALVGVDLMDRNVDEDAAAAARLIGAGLPLEIRSVREEQDPNEMKGWIRRRNLLIVGGSKVNRATKLSLCELWNEHGAPPVRFLWPGYARDDETGGPSPSSRRMVEVHEHGKTVRLEQTSPEHHLGIVAVCREPFGSPDVTTVVVAGCSSDATKRIVTELLRPNLYYHYRPEWAQQKAGQPILFLFDSHGKSGTWRVVGFQAPKRKPGRKPGTKPRRLA